MSSFLPCFFIVLGKVVSEKSPLALGQFLGVFVNTLNSDGKCPVQDCENLQLPIQMKLS